MGMPTLYLGLRNGQIVAADIKATGKADVRVVRPIRYGIAKMRLGENDSVLAIDELGNCVVVMHRESVIPVMGTIKHAVVSSGTTLLSQGKGEKILKLMPIVGAQCLSLR
jgi:hypothetical protein